MAFKKNFGRGMFLLSIFVFVFFFVGFVGANKNFSNDSNRYLPGFDLEVPDRALKKSGDFSISSMSEKIVMNHGERDEDNFRKVIVVLKNPEDVWVESKYFDKSLIRDLKLAMKDFVVFEDVTAGNVRFDFGSFNGFSVYVTDDEYDLLLSNPLVDLVEDDLDVSVMLNESVSVVGAIDARDYSVDGFVLDGKGTSVCVIDTGIDYTHSAFGGSWGVRVIGGHSFLDDSFEDCSLNNSACLDKNGHGTHVAGIIGANSNIRGVAPGVKIVVVKALDANGEGSFSNIAKGIEWCTANKDKYNISVISMSLGSEIIVYSDFCDFKDNLASISSAVLNASSEGLFVVASTGNKGERDGISAPACISDVIRVGSSKKDDSFHDVTNIWSLDLLLAPGYNIFSSLPSNQIGSMSGTSMATPHVSGIISILAQYHNYFGVDLNKSVVFDLLSDTGKIIRFQNRDFVRVDIGRALDSLSSLGFSVSSPSSNFYNSEEVLINVSFSEYFDFDNSVSFSYNNTISTFVEPVNLSFQEGFYELIFWASDGIITNNKSVSFIVDITSPNISIVSPLNNTYYLVEQLLNLSVFDNYNVSAVWFNWNGTNTTFTESSYISFPNGTHSLNVWAEDFARNINQESVNFTINIIPPVIHNFSVNVSLVNSNTNVSFFINTSHNNSVSVFLNNHSFFNLSDKSVFNITTMPSVLGCADIEGACIVQLKIIDANKVSAYKNLSFFVDDLGPVISILSPLNKTYYSFEQLINLSVYDEFNVSSVWFNWNGTNSTYTESLNISFSNKTHTLNVWAEDIIGNINQESVIFKLLIIPPRINSFEVNESIVKSKKNVSFAINTSHNNSVSVFLNNISFINKTQDKFLNIITSPASIGCADIEGACNVSLKIVDVNNFSVHNNLSFFVDDVAPMINVSAPLNGSVLHDESVLFDFSVFDFSDFSCSVFIADSRYNVSFNESFVLDLSFGNSYSWYLDCVDVAGNVNSSVFFFELVNLNDEGSGVVAQDDSSSSSSLGDFNDFDDSSSSSISGSTSFEDNASDVVEIVDEVIFVNDSVVDVDDSKSVDSSFVIDNLNISNVSLVKNSDEGYDSLGFFFVDNIVFVLLGFFVVLGIFSLFLFLNKKV